MSDHGKAVVRAGSLFGGEYRYGDTCVVQHECMHLPMIADGQPTVMVEGMPIAYNGARLEEHKCMDLETTPPTPTNCKIKHEPWIIASQKTVWVGAPNGTSRPVARDGDKTTDPANAGIEVLQKDEVLVLGRTPTVFIGDD